MELFRALATLAESPRPESQGVVDALELGALPAAAEYTDLFQFQLYPYASVYLGPEGMLGGEARDRIAGFWRALSQSPPPEPDHLAVMLALQAKLAELEISATDDRERDGWRGARTAFLWEHLLSWLPAYLVKLGEVAPPFYRAWAELLEGALRAEVAAAGIQSRLPLHLRAAPAFADSESEADEVLGALLSPARSGVILVRADLRRAAADLGLGLRAGERLYALRALLSQEPAGTLVWLAGEARRWVGRHRSTADLCGEAIARHWAHRAQATGRFLDEAHTHGWEKET